MTPPPPFVPRRASILSRGRMLALAALLSLAAAAVFYALDPAGGMLPRCPFKAATGLDCPGCGAQRALHAAMHGEFVDAFAFNPLLALELPLMLLILAAELMPRRLAPLRRVTASRPFILTFLAIIILWTIYRNL